MRIYSILLINRRPNIILQLSGLILTCTESGTLSGGRSCVVTVFRSELSSEDFGTDVSGAAGSLGGGSCDSTDFGSVLVSVLVSVSFASVGFAGAGSGNISSPRSSMRLSAAFLYIYAYAFSTAPSRMKKTNKHTLSICFLRFLTPLSRQ